MAHAQSPKKLLIIEDDTDILYILGIIFKGEGYDVVLSETGAAIEDLGTIKPDLILLDLRLSVKGREGETICARLKSQNDTRDIPIILLSAERDLRQVCKECGANDFLSKPFDIDQLSGKVNDFVYLSKSTSIST